MHLENVTIKHDRFPTTRTYPFNLQLLQQTRSLDLNNPVTIFTGENGTGKSTLLKALCMKCNIHIWEGMYRTRFEVNQFEDTLHQALDITWKDGSVPGSFFSPELFRNFSQLVDEWASSNPGILKYYGGESLITKSHGQSCMAYFKSIYKIKGLYFLDEPESALSPKTQLELLNVLGEMSTAGHAQFIISTHSPILMSCQDAMLYSFDNNKIENTSFKNTSHFEVYNQFFKSF